MLLRIIYNMVGFSYVNDLSQVIRSISVNENKIFIYCHYLENVKYAYYLYKDSKVIEKIGYSFLSFFEFNKLEPGNYSVKVYLKLGDEKKSFKSNKLMVEEPCGIRIKELYLDPKVFDMQSFDNPYLNVVEQENKGFTGYGRKDLRPYKILLPLDWVKNPYNDRNWMFQLQSWRNLDAYLQCVFDVSIINKISSVINDWTEFEKNNKSEEAEAWLWYDMSTGLRALKLSFYLKKCQESRVFHNIDDLPYLIYEHLKHLSNINELSSGNHGLFQLNGLMSLCSIVDDSFDISIYKKFAINQMESLLKNQLGDMGVHTENSPDYHFFSIRAINKIISSEWWQKEKVSLYFNEILNKSVLASNWFVDPNNKCVPIGDSSYSIFRARKKEALLWPHEKKGNIIAAQLDGYAVIRTNFDIAINKSSFLFFQGAFYSHTHKHSDCLSFIWQEKGNYILSDGGKYGYQKDKYRKYFLSNKSHNTLIVDNLDYPRSKKDVCGSSIIQSPIFVNGMWVISGAKSYNLYGYTHIRIIIYKPSYGLHVIDKVISQKKGRRKVILNWLFSEDFSVEKKKRNEFIAFGEKNKINYQVMTNVGDVDIKEYIGMDSDNEIKGWISKDYLKVSPTLNVNVEFVFSDSVTVVSHFSIKESYQKSFITLKRNKILSDDIELSNLINGLLDNVNERL